MIIFPVNHFIRALPALRKQVPVYQYLEFPDLRLWFKYNRFCPFSVRYTKTMILSYCVIICNCPFGIFIPFCIINNFILEVKFSWPT
jgi:hypothetical protein